MGFWDFLRRSDPAPVAWFTPNVTYLGSAEEMASVIGGMTPGEMWSTQPHLRTVVTFLARNIAQLGVHSFQRRGEDRVRDRVSPFARTMLQPNADQTAYELVFALVGDLSLYDRAYWLVVEDDSASGWSFRRLPPPWVNPIPRDAFGNSKYAVLSPKGERVEVPAEDVLAFTGYHPTNPRMGSPTIEALKDTLQEQVEAARYRGQVWKRGGRVSAVLQRPKDAPDWSDGAREAFREDWYAKYTGKGSKAGGTPILEDGMTLQRIDFNAQEQQFVEAAKLSFATVASAFHVNPTMVGILDNANYSNVREFRRMLYGDTLGPLLAQIEARINTFLLPRLGMDNAEFYAEFNIGEKLQGSFEEQAAVMQTLVGAPLMTRNEGRARFNLPGVEGGDQLITPLNVLEGGQASPTDSGSQNRSPKAVRPAKVKAALTDGQRDDIQDVLSAFFRRQGRSVLSAMAGDGDWWDGKRWDAELADDLHAAAQGVVETIGKAEAARMGYRDGFDVERTAAFLRKVAERQASTINKTTRKQLEEVDDDATPADVFAQAEVSRAPGIAEGVGAFLAGFASLEAGEQLAFDRGVKPMKTWVTGPNPRAEHAALDGETVPIDEAFSNGMSWPGEGGDLGDVGCNCSVNVSIPEED